ncbi:MAG: protein-L-isoaspartate O-methyltransferase family protein [Ktedonobacteraceae bacterium]
MGEMRQGTKSEQARAQLVAALRATHTIGTDHVANAFLQVPREVFVPVFYEQERSTGYPWMPRSRDWYPTEDAWLDAIYRDEPLVTLVDQYNVPISSSSAPSVMAMMLEASKVRLGMRVLEIGTGSGFNTALLATLNHCPELVYTIDVEETLVHLAKQRLHTHIGPIVTHVGDGRLGFPTESLQYECILATASAPEIPAAWYGQLAPGGRLILPLQGMLNQGSFLIIEKDAHGNARGWFDARSLHFMPLRATTTVPVHSIGSCFNSRSHSVSNSLMMRRRQHCLAAETSTGFCNGSVLT